MKIAGNYMRIFFSAWLFIAKLGKIFIMIYTFFFNNCITDYITKIKLIKPDIKIFLS